MRGAGVRCVIKKHGGLLTADSTAGAGSCFRFYLPAAEGAPRPRPAPARGVTPGRGRILVMDDEESIRLTLGSVLHSAGCSVAFTRDGAEALERFRAAAAAGRPFDAALLDLTIPGGMGGVATLKELLREAPALRAIVLSGDSHDAALADFAESL